MTVLARYLSITGKVQGVGFRPYIYRLAYHHGLSGWVRNCSGQVGIHIQGSESGLNKFCETLIPGSPVISAPHIEAIKSAAAEQIDSFKILSSESSANPDIHIPVDFFTCKDCLQELRDPAQRRFHYPFTNCTQCGPRYTIINSLPYDRPSTSMAGFPLCDACRKEYRDPLDRRFHAQPLACADCGPSLSFNDSQHNIQDTQMALIACIDTLKKGRIIAVKGIGGYHLLCDADNDQAIARLRQQKPRPDKPLAVLFPERGDDGLAAVQPYLELSPAEADLLRSPERPVVLAKLSANNIQSAESLSELIAPGLLEIGAMLPYSPLHYLLLDGFGRPLVATSANISGEPVLTENTEVELRLSHVAEGYLHHNRKIVRPADDPVYRTIAGRPRPLRIGRGNAPLEFKLPFALSKPVLATGSHMKNTIALAWDRRLVVSPHIGDLDSLRSQQVFEQVIGDLQQLYQVAAEAVICDAHPSYASSRWAAQCNLPLTQVFHHRAHASALVLDYFNRQHSSQNSQKNNHNENWKNNDWLVFAWDGVGYGEDGSLWGGEALHGKPGSWQRVASMQPFFLPGGEKAGREPWRSAAALCWQTGISWPGLPAESHILHQAWQQRMNSPMTSSVGRLFDAAAALTGILQKASFEGQGPMLLEQASDKLQAEKPLPVIQDENGVWSADWSELPAQLMDATQTIACRAAQFHARMAHTLLRQAQLFQQQHHVQHIGLCGGVFQNRKLADYAIQLLEENDFTVHLPERLPANDAAISTGQVMEYGTPTPDHRI